MSKNLTDILSKEVLERAASQGACLQRIQMYVWDYMQTPKHRRNGVDLAEKIFRDVEQTLKMLEAKERREHRHDTNTGEMSSHTQS